MKSVPFCRECVFYGGRRNGVGVCNLNGQKYEAEHIKGDFWCINGKLRGARLVSMTGNGQTGVLTAKETKMMLGN